MRPGRDTPRILTIAQLQAACILYIAAWCLFPPLAIDLVWRVALAAAVAAFFALEAIRNGLGSLYNWPAGLVLSFTGYTLLVQLLTGGMETVLAA
ncbi:MAG: hypothetical protein AAFW98_12905, partial [Pseudomonadota bacterium]